MLEIVRQTVIRRFNEAISSSIETDQKRHPHEWKENPFHGPTIILAAINTAKNEYKQMLKENCTEFGIEKNQVDTFVDGIAENVRTKLLK